MHRIRITLISAAMVSTLAVLTLNSMAQPPGAQGGRARGGPGGPGGFGGPGGPGGFGGPGGPGGSVFSLVMNPAVQEELKLKEPQKAKLKSFVDTYNERQRVLGEQQRALFMPPGQGPGQGPGPGQGGGRGQNQGGGRGQNRNANPDAQAGVGGGNGGGGNGGGGNGGGGNGGGGNGNPGGGRRNRPQLTPEQQEQLAELREGTQQLQLAGEQNLVKLIGSAAYTRLKQIQLQLEGPRALLREDMVEKLNLAEEQVEQIQGLLNESRQVQGETRRAQFDLMKAAFPAPADANGGNNGQNGGGANGNNGQNGGRRGNNRPNFQDPAFQDAMKAYMEKPEVKEKMAEFQSQQEKQDVQLMAAVQRALGKRQAAAYKKMLGAPFDLSKIRGGGPGRGFGRNGPGNQAAVTKNGSAAKAAPGSDDEEPAVKSTATSTKKATPAAAAKTRKKSLAAERGLDE
jgi:hypothetical protein